MKVALIHDWLVTNAGAEKVLRQILECFPDADVFSLVDFLDDMQKEEVLMGKEVTTSFVQNLPFAKKYFRNYLPLFPMAIERFDLSGYELIISSSWAFAKGIKKPKNALHVSYCHTPIRYAWDLYDEYTLNLPQPKKYIVQKTLKYIRKWDVKASVDFFIANSNFVARRIKKTYNKNSHVIYPPVDTDKFGLHVEKKEYYLTASRLVGYKKTALIVEAFNELKLPLVVIGGGEELEHIKQIANENIQILGYQKDSVLIKYMQEAKCFVYMALEDFGIVPLEALSCGTPVIALGSGGTYESIIDEVVGLHVKEQTKQSLIKTIKKFETNKISFNPHKLRVYAKKFSKQRFKEQIKEYFEVNFYQR